MRPAGRLVTIKRSGDDGAHFPLSLSSCLFGRSIECDIRIQLPVVSKQHCKIEVKEQTAILHNFSSTNPTQVNGSAIHKPVQLKHGDVITIIDRSFRYENESHENGRKSPGPAGKRCEQEPEPGASRSSRSADPGEKGPESKAHSDAPEGNASRRSLMHARRLTNSSTWSVSEDSEGHMGHDDRNAGEPTSRDLKEKSRVAGSHYKERKSFPSARSLDEGKKSESPFKKLYQSLKEELGIKSQKEEADVKPQKQGVLQCRRKSLPPSDCATIKERELQLVSHKPRPRSGGSIPVQAVTSPELKTVQTQDLGSGVQSSQTSKEAVSPSLVSERAEVKNPVQNSQPLKDEAPHGTQRRESESLDESEGVGTTLNILTPEKLGARNPMPVKAEGATHSDAKPVNISSRKRSTPAETQTQAPSTLHLAQGETKTEKDALNKPEKLATTAGQMCSGLPGLSSVDISNLGDSINKTEGVSLKRRRVSFGGCLRPELFDENLPPSTPLKRGETPIQRRSLVTHTPVLKKIIKEQPPSLGKDKSPGICLKAIDQELCLGASIPSPGITPSRMTSDQRRRSERASLDSGDSKSPHQVDLPKKAGRKSGNLSSRRSSISRSQHGILQMICSKRRSGASDANLIVAKSWADVVKLGTKQTQMKMVKQSLQQQISKRQRQRRPNTPKKPTSSVHNQFSTGHANSPCTIVIGKAQIEKVNLPARPYRMLNNFVLKQKLDFSEDLSGLTEMFQTPAKEKQKQRGSRDSIVLSNSENLLGKQRQVTDLGEKLLPIASDILGADMLSSPLDAAEEGPNQYYASPTLRRRSMNDGNSAKTTGSVAEPLKTVSSANKFRRSREFRDSELPPVESKSGRKEDLAEGVIGRYLRKTPLKGQQVKGEAQGSEQVLQRCKENVKSEENPETTPAMRKSRCEEPKCEFMKDLPGQMVLKAPGCAQEPACEEKRATKTPSKSSKPEAVDTPKSRKRQLGAPLWNKDEKEALFASVMPTQASEESTHAHKAPKSDDESSPVFKGTPKQKVDPEVYATGTRQRLRTPEKKTQLPELRELFQTSERDDPMGDDETKVFCKAPQPSTEDTESQLNTPQRKENTEEELSTLTKLEHLSKRNTPMQRMPDHACSRTKAVKESAKQAPDPAANVTSSKRRIRKSKKAESLEDLTGFPELFQTPGCGRDAVSVDKTTTMPWKSPPPGPGRTPGSTKRLSKRSLGEAHVGAEFSALGEITQAPLVPAQQGKSPTAFMETPEQKLEPIENLTGHKRRPRIPKDRTQFQEELTGLQELFQTPAIAQNPVVTGETKQMPFDSPQPEPVRTTTSTKRLSKRSLGKGDVKEDLSALRAVTQSAGKAMPTSTVPVKEEKGVKAITEIPEQELEPTRNASRQKRRSRTPKRKSQLLEDLAGLLELFQTPGCASDSVTLDKTPRMSLKSQSNPIRTPASTQRLPKRSLGITDVGEELPAPRKSTQLLGRATHTPTVPVNLMKGAEAITETPEPELDPTGNSSRPKRRPRTPKRSAQLLEDLAGLQELFQTPGLASNQVTVDKTPRMSLKSQSDPIRTPASTQRLPKRSLGITDVGEELPAPRKSTQLLGRATHTPTVPVNLAKGAEAITETPEPELDPTGNSSGPKRRPRTPKRSAQLLEDLAGLQELFQTPGLASNQVTVDKTPRMSLKSQSDPIRTPASTQRLPKRSLGITDVGEELPAPRKSTQLLGRATHTPTVPVNQAKGAEAITETPEPELDPTGNASRPKRRPRTPKRSAQLLEDLAGLQELFQTPSLASDSLTIGQTMRLSYESPQSGPVKTPKSTKKLPKISLGEADVREELSALGEPTQSPGKALCTPTAPAQQEKGTVASMDRPKQKLKSTGNLTGLQKQPRVRKEKAQPLEDLAGFQELFQTPARASHPVTVDPAPRLSLNSLQPESARTPASTRRSSKKSLRNVGVGEELSGYRTLLQTSGETAHMPRLTGEDRGLGAPEQPVKQKLDPATRAPGSKRPLRAPKEKTQPPEDLTGLQELFQTPGRAQDSATGDETTQLTYRSPQTEPVRTPASTKRLPRTSLGKVSVEDKLSVLRRPAQSPSKVTHTPIGPVQEEEEAEAVMGSAKQKLEPTVDITGHQRLSGTPKEKLQSLEDLSAFQELFQTPAHASDPVTAAYVAPKKSPWPEPVTIPTRTERLSRTSLGRVEAKVRLSPLNKLIYVSEDLMLTPSLLEGAVGGSKDLKDPKVSRSGSKKQQGGRKKKAQTLEDLAGLQELFQSPHYDKDSVTIDKTTDVPSKSPQAEALEIPLTSKRHPRTGLRKVHEKKELAGFKVLPQISDGAVCASQMPSGDRSLRSSKRPAKRKLDPSAMAPGSKRLRWAPEEKTQPLEGLTGLQEPLQAPGFAENSVTMDRTPKVHKSPKPVEVSTLRPKTRLRKVDVVEEPVVQRKQLRTSRETRSRRREPVSDTKSVEELKESLKQKEKPAARGTGRRRLLRTVKEKVQTSHQELIQMPYLSEETASHEKATKASCKSPQPEQRDSPAASKRRLRMRVCKVDMKEEPIVQRQPSGRETRSAHREPTGNSQGVPEPKQSAKRKLDPAASVPGSKRLRRAPKEKTQPPEHLAGSEGPFHTPGHTEESLSDEKPTQVPQGSSQPEKVDTPNTSSRRPRTRRGKAEVEEPSAVRKTVRASRQTTRSHKLPEVGGEGISVSKEAGRLTLDTAPSVTGSRRRLRTTPKEELQPQEVSREAIQTAEHTELVNDSQSLKSPPDQMPGPVKPLRASRRVLRAPQEKPTEALAPPSDTAQAPTRTSRRDGCVSRARGLRSVAPMQEAADEKPLHRTQRTASSERHLPSKSPKMKWLRIVTRRIELVEEQISNSLKNKEKKPKRADAVAPDQKMPLRSRCQNATNAEQQKPEVVLSAEKTELKRNGKKPLKSPQEMELQNQDDEAKKSKSRGKVSRKRTCLRSGGPSESSPPPAAEEKVPQKSVGIPKKSQKEKTVTGDAGVRSLRSRKAAIQPTGHSLDSEPEPRVTRGARKGAENPKKDIAYTKKLRTRSHWDSEDV